MADGLTPYSEYAQFQGANTQILKDDGKVLDSYFKAAENQYRNKVFNYNKTKDEIDNTLKQLDFNIAGTWEQDLPVLNEYPPKLTAYANEHPYALNPTATKRDLDAHNEFNRIKNEGIYLATKSKQDKAAYSLWQQKILTDNDLSKHAADYLQELNQWRNTPIKDRGDFNLIPKLDDNPIADAAEMDAAAIMKDEKLGKVESIGGGLEAVPKTTDVDTKGAEQVAQYKWQTNPDVQRMYQGIWNNLPEDQKKSYTTPYDYYLAVRKAHMKVQPKTTYDVRDVPKPPSSGSGTKTTQEDVQQRKELIYKIQNKDEGALDILRGLKYGGVPPLLVEYKKLDTPNSPTTIHIQTQQGQDINIEVSEKTGGGFLALNQLINALEGQKKISVEDLSKEKEYKTGQKSYTYKGKPYTQEQVEKAAKQWGLTVDEYVKKYLTD